MQESSMEDPTNAWDLSVDGSSNSTRLRVGLVLTRLEGVVAEYAQCFEFPVMNNKAEYEALVIGL